MPNYRIHLTNKAYVETMVNVTANTKEEAREEAKRMGRSGDVEWVYDGIIDRDDMSMDECEEIE